jgi:hypothetical protein
MLKPVPVVGSAFAIGLAGYEIRKKGLVRGAIHVGLDLTPFVGTAKGVIEVFTGDLIPDKKPRPNLAIPKSLDTHADPEAAIDPRLPADEQ